MKKNKVLERILITKDQVSTVESDIRFHEHLRRYASVRRFCFGRVIDFASGCGYGSHILSVNPDVELVIGIDKDKEAIDWAKKEFENKKTNFRCVDIEDVNEKFDTLVSLEAIEHFSDLTLLPRLTNRCQIDQVIISFPNKKSTHFNPYHVHNFCSQDILNLLPDFICYHSYQMGDVQFLLLIIKPKSAPAHIFNNILDLSARL